MSRTVRTPMARPAEHTGDRCYNEHCQRCANDAHFNRNGERSDKFSGWEINFRRECGEARTTQRRQHRRSVARTVATMATNREAWDDAAGVTYDARRTGGWLTH